MIAVSYNLVGYYGLKYKLRKERMARPLRNYWERCGQHIADQARENTYPNIWRRDVYDSIDYKVHAGSPAMGVDVFADSAHALFLEKGTEPGYFPNVDNLSEYTDEPFLLGRHIEEFGTKAHPFLEPAAWESVPELVAYVGVLALEIEMAFVAS